MSTSNSLPHPRAPERGEVDTALVEAFEKALAHVKLTPAQRMKLREIVPEVIEQVKRESGIGEVSG